jgi:hypothetical protein
MRGPHGVAALVALLSGSVGHEARGSDPAGDVALAEALFEEGRRLLVSGQVDAACAKLAESYRADPALGTLLNLANCHERQNKTATAWAEFASALAEAHRAGQRDREGFARSKWEELGGRLCRIIVRVPADAGDIEVELDGKPIGPGVWGMPVPVDPGEHVVNATAPSKEPFSRKVVLAHGPSTEDVLIPHLGDARPDPAGAVASSSLPISGQPEAPVATERESPAETSPSSDGGARATGLLVGGFGIASMLVGGYFGLHVYSLKSQRDAHCSPDVRYCDGTGLSLNDDAHRAALVSTITIGAGVVAAGVGGYLVLWSRPHDSTGVAHISIGPVAPGTTGAALSGMF